MRPTDAGSAADTGATDSDSNTWRALQEATDTTRANLIADIVGHPRNSITVEERNGLFPEEAWTRQYQAVEKTPQIRDVEGMPRPTESGETEIQSG